MICYNKYVVVCYAFVNGRADCHHNGALFISLKRCKKYNKKVIAFIILVLYNLSININERTTYEIFSNMAR